MPSFFAWLEARVRIERTADLSSQIDAEVLGALRAAGILRPASRARTRPCDDPTKRCFRNVRPAAPPSPFPFTAICNAARPGCSALDVTLADVAQEELSVPDLLRAVRALYGVDGRGLSLPSTLDASPVMLGWQETARGEREVRLAVQKDFSLRAALSGRRRGLVLVPTARAVTGEWRARHNAGAFIELDVLEESLIVRDGRLARRGLDAHAPDAPVVPEDARSGPAPRANAHPQNEARLADPPPRMAVTRAPQAQSILGAKKWTDVRISLVDPLTVRIDVPGRSCRRTHIDLGMAHARTREPTRVWELLVAMCEGSGSFRWKQFGDFQAAAKIVSRLRASMRAIFGIPGSPFYPYRAIDAWRARFDARPELPYDF
jgi:hypothetical protein